MQSKIEIRKPKMRVSREGWLWLAASVLLLGIGLYKGINLLCLLASAMLGVLALNLFLAGRGLGRLRGQRRISGPVFAGTPFRVELQATNPRRAALIGFSLEDVAPGQLFAGFVPRLSGGQTIPLSRESTLPRRGQYSWGALRAVSGYPFGLAQRRVRLAAAEEVLVLPRMGRLHRGRLQRHLRPFGPVSSRTNSQPRPHPTAQAEFHGLRAFRNGDSPRWIHWRTSAHCGELMVREFEVVPTDNLILVLDPWRPEEVASDQCLMAYQQVSSAAKSPAGTSPLPLANLLEDAISLAATICSEWCRQRGDRFVLAVASSPPIVIDGATSPDHALRMLECLAMLAGEARPDLGALLDRLADTALPPATVMLVSPRDPAPLQAALSQRLRRPVVALDVSSVADVDFYESPR